MQFKQLRIETCKSQDFNGVWTRDLASPVRRTNQLSYEIKQVANKSFIFSDGKFPKNENFLLRYCYLQVVSLLILSLLMKWFTLSLIVLKKPNTIYFSKRLQSQATFAPVSLY